MAVEQKGFEIGQDAMIKSLSLRNFQSHKHTEISFSPAITVIVGTSNSGKSAIFRALEWIRINRPRGTSFIRNGSDGHCCVELVLDVEGKEVKIVRERKGDSVNKYVVGDEVHKALGASVPEEVLSVLGLGDLNVQKQLEQHFMVLDSPGSIAQKINTVSKIEEADKIKSVLSSKGRKTASEINHIDEELLCIDHDLSNPVFEVLADFASLLSMYEEITKKLATKSRTRSYLEGCLVAYEQGDVKLGRVCVCVDQSRERFAVFQELCCQYQDKRISLDSISSTCFALVDVNSRCSVVDDKLTKLSSALDVLLGGIGKMELFCLLQKYLYICDRSVVVCNKLRCFCSQLELLDKLVHIALAKEQIQTSLASVVDIVRSSINLSSSAQSVSEKINMSRKSLADLLDSIEICPVCGQKTEGDHRQAMVECLSQ